MWDRVWTDIKLPDHGALMAAANVLAAWPQCLWNSQNNEKKGKSVGLSYYSNTHTMIIKTLYYSFLAKKGIVLIVCDCWTHYALMQQLAFIAPMSSLNKRQAASLPLMAAVANTARVVTNNKGH